MKTTTISKLSEYVGLEVTINGWVYSIRNIGKIWFIILRDGTGLLQGVVVKGEATDPTFNMEQALNKEDSVSLRGFIKKEPRSVGGYEMGVSEIKIINPVSNEFPISPKEHGADFLMSNRHLWLRSKRQNAIMKIRHRVVKSIRDFFDDNDFILIDCPPSLSMLTINAMAAAESVVIPIQCEYYALEGLSALMNTIARVADGINPNIKIEGLLRTMYDPRNSLTNDVSAQLIQHFGGRVYETVIPRNVRLAEAPSHGEPVLSYDPQSKGAIAYLALAAEVLQK